MSHYSDRGNSMAIKKILVVEDDILLQEMMKELLQANGFDVVIATNGREGLEVARTQKPDFIFADLMMPELDGIQLTKELKANESTTNIPIVLASGLGFNKEAKEAIRAGAADFISKPYKAHEILEKIKQIVK